MNGISCKTKQKWMYHITYFIFCIENDLENNTKKENIYNNYYYINTYLKKQNNTQCQIVIIFFIYICLYK